MTSREQELFDRAVELGVWDWRPGMLALEAVEGRTPLCWRVENTAEDGLLLHVLGWDESGEYRTALIGAQHVTPDFADDATKGALLGLVRERLKDPRLGVWFDDSDGWIVCTSNNGLVTQSWDSEPDALLATLIAGGVE